MSSSSRIARPMLAGIFVAGGIAALRQPGQKAEAVKQSGVQDKLPPKLAATSPENLVRLNAAADLLGGFALATGRAPRLASLGLLASLVPTTYTGHPFWTEKDKAARAQQQTHFFKNLAMAGGLLLSAADTGGRETVPHAAGRLGRKAKRSTRKAARQARKDAVSMLSSSSSSGHDYYQAALSSDAVKAAKKQAPKIAKKANKNLQKAAKTAQSTAQDVRDKVLEAV
jgi:putative oxidoreductase